MNEERTVEIENDFAWEKLRESVYILPCSHRTFIFNTKYRKLRIRKNFMFIYFVQWPPLESWWMT